MRRLLTGWRRARQNSLRHLRGGATMIRRRPWLLPVAGGPLTGLALVLWVGVHHHALLMKNTGGNAHDGAVIALIMGFFASTAVGIIAGGIPALWIAGRRDRALAASRKAGITPGGDSGGLTSGYEVTGPDRPASVHGTVTGQRGPLILHASRGDESDGLDSPCGHHAADGDDKTWPGYGRYTGKPEDEVTW